MVKHKKKIKTPCEICGNVTYLHTHHIRGRKIPMANASGNLTMICANCHNEIHHGDLILEDWVLTSSGRELMFFRKGEESFTGEEAEVHIFGKKVEKVEKKD